MSGLILCGPEKSSLTIIPCRLSLWNLRGEVVKRLLQPVELISGKEADGKEFEITLDKQADLDAHMTAYGDALADRREMITEVVRQHTFR